MTKTGVTSVKPTETIHRHRIIIMIRIVQNGMLKIMINIIAAVVAVRDVVVVVMMLKNTQEITIKNMVHVIIKKSL